MAVRLWGGSHGFFWNILFGRSNSLTAFRLQVSSGNRIKQYHRYVVEAKKSDKNDVIFTVISFSMIGKETALWHHRIEKVFNR